MIQKYLKYLSIVSIDVLVYRMTPENILPFPQLGFTIQSELLAKGKKKYFITENGVCVHSSTLFNTLYILNLILKKGPAIGDCFTHFDYRGKSIYSFVLNYIAKEMLLENKSKELFIIVNSTNISSIRGIEKAGFKKIASIKARRWLLFYFKKDIVLY